MKLGFVILAHNQPEAVQRLVRILSGDGHKIVIHFDTSAPTSALAKLTALEKEYPGQVRVISEVHCVWGEWSLVDAVLRALREFESMPDKPDYIHLMSGADFPIRPISDLVDFLGQNPGKDFIECCDISKRKWVKGGLEIERFQYFYPFNFLTHRAAFDKIVRWHRKSKIRRKIPLGMKPHMGSQWWTMRWETCSKILSFLKEHPGVVRYFRTTWIPDEAFFQTLVAHLMPVHEIADLQLMFHHLTPTGRPYVIHMDHINVVSRLPHFFVRKVAPAALGGLEEMIRSRRSPVPSPALLARTRDFMRSAINRNYEFSTIVPGHPYGAQPWKRNGPVVLCITRNSYESQLVASHFSSNDDFMCVGRPFLSDALDMPQELLAKLGLTRGSTQIREQYRDQFISSLLAAVPEFQIPVIVIQANNCSWVPESLSRHPQLSVISTHKPEPFHSIAAEQIESDVLNELLFSAPPVILYMTRNSFESDLVRSYAASNNKIKWLGLPFLNDSLDMPEELLEELELTRESTDVRDKDKDQFVYSLLASVPDSRIPAMAIQGDDCTWIPESLSNHPNVSILSTHEPHSFQSISPRQIQGYALKEIWGKRPILLCITQNAYESSLVRSYVASKDELMWLGLPFLTDTLEMPQEILTELSLTRKSAHIRDQDKDRFVSSLLSAVPESKTPVIVVQTNDCTSVPESLASHPNLSILSTREARPFQTIPAERIKGHALRDIWGNTPVAVCITRNSIETDLLHTYVSSSGVANWIGCPFLSEEIDIPDEILAKLELSRKSTHIREHDADQFVHSLLAVIPGSKIPVIVLQADNCSFVPESLSKHSNVSIFSTQEPQPLHTIGVEQIQRVSLKDMVKRMKSSNQSLSSDSDIDSRISLDCGIESDAQLLPECFLKFGQNLILFAKINQDLDNENDWVLLFPGLEHSATPHAVFTRPLAPGWKRILLIARSESVPDLRVDAAQPAYVCVSKASQHKHPACALNILDAVTFDDLTESLTEFGSSALWLDESVIELVSATKKKERKKLLARIAEIATPEEYNTIRNSLNLGYLKSVSTNVMSA